MTVCQRDDGRVETKLLFQMKGTSETTLAGAIGRQVLQELLTATQSTHVRATRKNFEANSDIINY